MRLHTSLTALALFGAGLFLVGVPGPASASSARTVVMKDIDFKPGVVHVRRGTRVTWANKDKYAAHNVKSRGRKRFRSSGTFLGGGSYSVKFSKPGTYRYVCTLHPGMNGRIVVK